MPLSRLLSHSDSTVESAETLWDGNRYIYLFGCLHQLDIVGTATLTVAIANAVDLWNMYIFRSPTLYRHKHIINFYEKSDEYGDKRAAHGYTMTGIGKRMDGKMSFYLFWLRSLASFHLQLRN